MRLANTLIFGVFFVYSAIAEPYLSPNNPFIRHEIRLLADEGELNSLQNTWPLDFGGIVGTRTGSSYQLPHSLLDDRISQESESGWSPITTTLSISDDRVTARGFGPEPRSSFASNASVSWMNDRFAAKLSLNAFYGMEKDWKGRKYEGMALDGSYIAARLGNWSASFGQVERWWGPGWDGSLILSTNARPIPAISFDRRVPEPFETKWLSWIGPWSFHSFIGQMEDERDPAIDFPNHYLWGMRGEIKPTLIDGLEIGFFRMLQLGGDGRTNSLKMWMDGFLSQDNEVGTEQPGNQLAGIDLRWKIFDLPVAIYGQVAGEDEENFFPEALFFQWGIEAWEKLEDSTLRLFVEYADLTSYWWTGDPRHRNITYGHEIYGEGYRYRGRPIGHWADQDSQILSIGGLLFRNDGVGWGATFRTGDLNAGPLLNPPPHDFSYNDLGQPILNTQKLGNSTVSNGLITEYLSFDIFNARQYQQFDLSIHTSLGWESLHPKGAKKDDGLSGFLSLTRVF